MSQKEEEDDDDAMSITEPEKAPMCKLMGAAIAPDDLDFELDPDAMNTLNEFDIAWRKFMKDHPELVPEGKREKHIKQLQKQVQELEKTQADANDELHKQLDFFEKSREAMEKQTKKELEEARAKQIKTQERLQKQLDSIAIAEHLLSQAYPWEHFLAAVDKAAALAKQKETNKDPSAAGAGAAGAVEHDKKAKPSTRALYLVDDTAGDERDIELRAYQIDHALLDCQVKMLQKEAEGYEKLLETQATLRMFLSDYDVPLSTASKSSKASKLSNSILAAFKTS